MITLFSKNSIWKLKFTNLNYRYPTWTYKCENLRCVKQLILNSESSDREKGDVNGEEASEKCQSLISCKMKCGERDKSNLLWPHPTGNVNLSETTFNFLPVRIIVIV